jgi:hypothetical protein
MTAGERHQMTSRLNGVLGGVLAPESWSVLGFYYGFLRGTGHHRAEVIEGTPIDLLDHLDAIAEGPPKKRARRDSEPANVVPLRDVVAALRVIKNDDLPWETNDGTPSWLTVLFAVACATGRSREGYEAFVEWSKTSQKHGKD